MKALEPAARLCYSESVKMESTEFIKMLLLDGCFILEWFSQFESQVLVDPICHVGWAYSFLWSDLFLMENQIPLFVIHKLFTIQKGDSNLNCTAKTCPLLKLCSKPLSQIVQDLQQENVKGKSRGCWPFRVPWYELDESLDGSSSINMGFESGYNIPCVSELREAGISFTTKLNPRHMFDISFEKGIMEMPIVKIKETNKVILCNMVAFEQSQPYRFPQILSSYLSLMDSLINTAKDVAVLERAGIVENFLQNDEVAADFFNQFTKSFTLGYNHDCYRVLYWQLKEYSSSNWHLYRARLMHDYFRNPWSIISVVAAAILLILTFMQTYFSAKS